MQANENLLLVSAILFLDTVWIDRGQLQIQIWSSKHHITSHLICWEKQPTEGKSESLQGQ